MTLPLSNKEWLAPSLRVKEHGGELLLCRPFGGTYRLSPLLLTPPYRPIDVEIENRSWPS